MTVQIFAFDPSISAAKFERFLRLVSDPRGGDDVNATDPQVCCPTLLGWYREMSLIFPSIEQVISVSGDGRWYKPSLLAAYAFDAQIVGVTLLEAAEMLGVRRAKGLAEYWGAGLMWCVGGAMPEVWMPPREVKVADRPSRA